jgi:hypothetical protein
LPLLEPTKKDAYEIKNNGENYFHTTMDMLEAHKNKYFRTASAYLLQKVVSKYDLSSRVLNFVLRLADMSITSNFDNSTEYETYLKLFTQEQNLDMCLLVMTILSDDILKSKTTLLRTFLDTHLDMLLSVNSNIIKNRLCLFFGAFLDSVYGLEYSDKATKVIEFLFQQLFVYNDAPGVSYQAANSLNSLISHKNYSLIISDIVKKIILVLVNSIKEIEVDLFFDVLLDIVIYLDIDDHALYISREVTQRILKEVKSVRINNPESDYNDVMNKCFKVLMAIVEKYHFSNIRDRSDNSGSDIQVVIETSTFELNELEKIIQPLVLYLKNPVKIYFDDDLLVLLTKILHNSKEVTEFMKEIFTFLPKYLQKHFGINTELYELINAYVTHGEEFLKDEQSRNILLDIIKLGIEEDVELEESPVYAAFLARSWFEVKFK